MAVSSSKLFFAGGIKNLAALISERRGGERGGEDNYKINLRRKSGMKCVNKLGGSWWMVVAAIKMKRRKAMRRNGRWREELDEGER